VFLGLFHVVWDEGAGYRFQENAPGLALDCVVLGQLAFRPDLDEVVIRADTRQAPQPAPGGVETTLGPGDCILLHADVHRDERNIGPGLVDFVAVVLLPGDTPTPAGAPEAIEFGPMGYINPWDWGREPSGSSGAIQLSLRRVTLAPGAQVAEYAAAGETLLSLTKGTLSLTATAGSVKITHDVSFDNYLATPAATGEEARLSAGDAAHLPTGAAVTMHNPGDSPASAWLVTVIPLAEGAATPVA
jgi:quercetin dioxygenase-like cupin family protein